MKKLIYKILPKSWKSQLYDFWEMEDTIYTFDTKLSYITFLILYKKNWLFDKYDTIQIPDYIWEELEHIEYHLSNIKSKYKESYFVNRIPKNCGWETYQEMVDSICGGMSLYDYDDRLNPRLEYANHVFDDMWKNRKAIFKIWASGKNIQNQLEKYEKFKRIYI